MSLHQCYTFVEPEEDGVTKKENENDHNRHNDDDNFWSWISNHLPPPSTGHCTGMERTSAYRLVRNDRPTIIFKKFPLLSSLILLLSLLLLSSSFTSLHYRCPFVYGVHINDNIIDHHQRTDYLIFKDASNLVNNSSDDISLMFDQQHQQHQHHRHAQHRKQLQQHNKRRDISSSNSNNNKNSDDHSGSNDTIPGANNGSDSSAVLKSYTTSNKSINFTHVELDSITGNIYVGAANWIFQLDSNTLRVEHAVRTGPIRDSPICPPSDCSGVDSNLVQITNNVNKVLLVEPYARMLIVCGSVHQGACTRHRLEDISQHEDLVPLPVASNDENSSTIAFVGPARYFGVQLTPILYVAATDSRLGPYRDMVPAISGRSLESSRLFTIIDRGFADSARVDISSNIRDYFLVHYIYGFYANDYVYFAQVQRRSYLRTLEEMGYVSRLARVCVSDAGFHTYTELTLECFHENKNKASTGPSTGSNNNGPYSRHRYRNDGHQNDDSVEEFNLLQDAIVIKAGADLSDSLNIERGSLVLIGVFANSYDHTNRPGGKSAMCVYPISEIEQRFAENIHLCYNGSVFSRNMDYIAGSVNQCPEPGAGNVYNFCNEAVKLNGSIPLRTQASIVFGGGTVLTAVAAGVTGQHTVTFLGTNYGSIKKILLSRGDFGQQFDEVSIDPNNPILSDLHVDVDQNPKYLIAASPYKVVKFPVETCVQHDSCDQCLQARNPYCGWCSLQKRCTIKSECLYRNQPSLSANGGGVDSSGVYHYPTLMTTKPNAMMTMNGHHHHHYGPQSQQPPQSSSSSSSSSSLFSTPRWLSLETSQCIDFQAIKPEFMPRNLLAPVELIINQLPPLPYGANYLCVFEQSNPIPAIVTRNGLTCQTPSIGSRPPIPIGQDHVNVNVAVRSSETDTDFIHRSFIFFDCSVHKSCKSCVMSAWDCNWCMHENLCTYNTSLCTRRVIVGENSPQNSLIKGVEHCPSFNIETEISIPNGARRELTVEVRNLIPSQDGFQCIVEIEQAKERVSARVRDNNIICNEMMFSYQEEIGQQRASLTVLWNSDTFIDRTNFTIYKCQYLGAYAGRADCSLCQTRDSKYGCVWCLNQCSYVDQCTDVPMNSCPPPRIDYIHPISGPVEGGTLVSIEGSNLGSSLDEIKDRVSIGGIPCQPIIQYNISIRVVCRTGPSLIGPQSALVVIGNRAGVTRAQEKFQYKIIELTDVNPKMGPQSGGTRIYLSGKNLNIGSNVAVYLDDLPCYVERALASSFQMSCRTSPAPYSSYVVTRLILMVDGANFTLANPFLYTSDPTIDRIEPLQSFFSGGRQIIVTGSQFTSIQQPRMLVFVPRSSHSHHMHHVHHNHHSFVTSWPPYSSLRQQTSTTPRPLIDSLSDSYEFRIDNYRLINESICTVLSPIKMICSSPMINGDLQLLASNLSQANLEGPRNNNNNRDPTLKASTNSTLHHIPNQIYLQIGFIMDGTISVLELDTYYPHLDSSMLYVTDPVIYSLNNGHGKSIFVGRVGEDVLPFKGDVLVIEGENLAVLLLTEYEMNITIGTQRCNTTSVTMRQIICQPPTYPPAPTDELGRRSAIELPAVVLKIGNMRRHLGYLHYGDYFYGYNALDGYGHDDSSRFYHQNHPPFGYGNRFEPVNSINIELLIVISILIGTILTIISVIILAAYKHKTTEAEREYKRIQLQMDTLENNVRSECKQAFAELQTDILQASGLLSLEDLPRISLPTHDERTYLLRMSFASGIPISNQQQKELKDSNNYNASLDGSNSNARCKTNGNQHHLKSLHLYNMFWFYCPYFQITDNDKLPGSDRNILSKASNNDYGPNQNIIANTSHDPSPVVENFYTFNLNPTAMLTNHEDLMGQRPGIVIEQFEQLLLNRTFLLILVETLEQQQKTFTVAERMRFASLLMITLLDRMEYSFDVMRHLLANFIGRNALSKHSNQLIKRNETVVEKMLIDWLSICLFKYAKEVSSGPLFLLFSAIKHQIDKGPVDYVTGNSRYSLSEEKLLREQIDYKTITVNVYLDEKLQQTIPVPKLDRYSNNNNLNTNQQANNTNINNTNRNKRRVSTLRNNRMLLNNNNKTKSENVINENNNNINNNGSMIADDISTPPDDVVGGSSSVGGTTTTVGTDQTSSTDITEKDEPEPGYPCRVLDCDTISQVKSKIIDTLYRCVPYAERPQIHDVELYWRCLKPKSSHRPLSATNTVAVNKNNNNNNNVNDYNGTEASFNSDHSCNQPINKHATIVDATNGSIKLANSNMLQDVYGVASMMSKSDADKIYNASRRSDVSLEMTDILLEDYDHSTQILTANEAIWRRLNTISHYGITDGAFFYLCLRSSSTKSPSYGDQSSLIYGKRFPKGNANFPTGSSVYRRPEENYPLRILNEFNLPPRPNFPGIHHGFQSPNPTEMYGENVEDNTMFHLYESIPADRHAENSSIQDSFYGISGGNLGTGMEAVYNLSNTSSQRFRSNYYHFSTMTGISNNNQRFRERSPQLNHQYEPFLGQSTRPPLRQDELYAIGNTRMVGSNSLTYQATPGNHHGNQSFSPNNLSQKLLLHSSNSNNYRLNHSLNRRSFARNVYDRLSLFMKGSRRHNKNNMHGKRPSMNRRIALSDYGSDDATGNERHNIWHLVKPSSLIADCIIGASGSFLYDDEITGNGGGGKGRYNLRTVRQRRALRRRRAKPFSNKSSSTQLAAAAAAALSASQMNLNQVGNGYTNSLSINSLANAAVAPATSTTGASAGTTGQHGASSTSPLSLITQSASSLLASLFRSNSQQALNSSISTYLVHRSIPEIYLTRLLTTKGTIQQYVDDFLSTIFTVNERLPIAIKWLFDFFDQEAIKNSIQDAETVLLWKSNSLIQKFWVTLLRMPEILFDIRSNVSIDVCLDVLAQNLIETCTVNFLNENGQPRLGKDSPASKLLCARDIANYQQMISKYYKDISLLPPIKESDIIAYMKDVSKSFEGKICKEKSLEQILQYCLIYKDSIFQSLASDPLSQQEHLHLKFETIVYSAMAAATSSDLVGGNIHQLYQSHLQQQQQQQQLQSGSFNVYQQPPPPPHPPSTSFQPHPLQQQHHSTPIMNPNGVTRV